MSDITQYIREAYEAADNNGAYIFVESGTHVISGPILNLKRGKPCTLQGAGAGLTRIVVRGNAEEPYIISRGERGAMLSDFRCIGITFDGEDSKRSLFDIQGMQEADFMDLRLLRFPGTPLALTMCWDSLFSKVQARWCGNEKEKINPVKILGMPTGKDPFEFGSNSLNFQDSCRFENNYWESLYIGKGCRTIRINGSKFHGESSKPKAYPHIRCEGAKHIIITESNITMCGTSPLQFDGCSQVNVSDNSFHGIKGNPILARNCDMATFLTPFNLNESKFSMVKL